MSTRRPFEKPIVTHRCDPIAPNSSQPQRKVGRPTGHFKQHRRIDALRSLLEHRANGLTLAEMAKEIGVTVRSVRRYLDALKFDKVDLVREQPKRGAPAIWKLDASSLPRRVELRRTQAYALLSARRMFQSIRGSAFYEELDIAVSRLIALAQRPGRGPNAGLPDARLEDRFLYLPYAPKDYSKRTEEFDDLFQAVSDLRPLHCTYRSSRDSKEERIVIYPYALVLYKEAFYCVGLHKERNEVRTFLLDRMTDTEVVYTERFELPKDFCVDDWFDGQFGIHRGTEQHKVIIDFHPRVVDLVRTRKVHKTQKLSPLPNGGVRLSMTVGDLTEVVSWVLGWGETAIVVEPAKLRDRVVQELEGALRGYLPQPRRNDEAKRAKVR